jgi:hypothetical protein
MTKIIATLVFASVLGTVGRADAVPAFARKYKTSCTTCHTIYPKLNPFGEQFRRNGYRFPGIDSDSVKAEPIEMGTDVQKNQFPDAVYPATLSPFPALAFGFVGQTVFHPDKNSSDAAANNNTVFSMDSLVAEGHLWAAGSVDDKITYFAELTAADGGIEVENASLFFNDLVGPAHAVNLAVGRRVGSYTSFGPHSTYFADMTLPSIPVPGLYGATTDPFVFNDNHNGIEVNGVLGCYFNYAAGLAAGTNLDTRNSANFYGHIGYKIGGATLDGEHTGGRPQDLEHETALTIDAFAYRAISRFNDAGDPTAMPPIDPALTKDTSLTFGGQIRAQAAELELDSGLFYQTDDAVNSSGLKVTTISQWNELSYLLYPWLAVGARVEYLNISPDGLPTITDLKVMPGVAALVRPNIKLTLTAPFEQATNADQVDLTAAGLAANAANVSIENESIQLQLWAAF